LDVEKSETLKELEIRLRSMTSKLGLAAARPHPAVPAAHVKLDWLMEN